MVTMKERLVPALSFNFLTPYYDSPNNLEEGGFKVREIAPKYRGVQFLLAKK